MNDIMYEKLMEYTKKNEIISIYNYEDTDSFDVGFLASINEEHYILKNLNVEGEYDGYKLKETSNVSALGLDEIYLRDIEKLNKDSKKEHSLINFNTENLVLVLLEYAMHKKHIVNIEINQSGNSDIQGIVNHVDDKCIIVEKISEHGLQDGVIYVDTEAISSIYCDTREERKVKRLYQKYYLQNKQKSN